MAGSYSRLAGLFVLPTNIGDVVLAHSTRVVGCGVARTLSRHGSVRDSRAHFTFATGSINTTLLNSLPSTGAQSGEHLGRTTPQDAHELFQNRARVHANAGSDRRCLQLKINIGGQVVG